MGLTFRGRTHELLNARLIAVLKQCNIKKKLAKKVTSQTVPVKIKKYHCLLIFEPPAEVVNVDFDKLKIDVQMKTSLVSLDNYFPENSGTSVVRYGLSYEGFKDVLQLRGATIVEMSFANNMMAALKAGMKKKAGKLNLNLPVKECF